MEPIFAMYKSQRSTADEAFGVADHAEHVRVQRELRRAASVSAIQKAKEMLS